MTVRTLAEAAAEVLNKTRHSAPAEHMHKGVEKYADQPAIVRSSVQSASASGRQPECYPRSAR